MNDHTLNIEIQKYINQMTKQEKLVLKIAEDHLESSFDITKSIGFIQWQNKK